MYRGLDSARALAFLLIFFHHNHLADYGAVSIQAFFVLSGFLLTPILVQMRSGLGTRAFFVNFYGRRALRIFPLYYFSLLAMGAALWISQRLTGKPGEFITGPYFSQLPWALTYTMDFLHASVVPPAHLLAHFWSLSVEEQFYLLWPMAVFFVPAQRFKTFLLIVIAFGPVVRYFTYLASSSGIFPWLNPRPDLVVYLLPFSHFDAFAIGGLFALHVQHRGNGRILALFVFIVAAGLFTHWLSTGDPGWSSLGYPTFMRDSYKHVWGYSLFNLLFALFLVSVRERCFLPGLMENRVMRYLGTISYGLYVYHLPIIYLFMRLGSGIPEWQKVVLSLTTSVVVAILSYELMEKRFLKLKDRYFSKTEGRAASATILAPGGVGISNAR